jgi:hypothetical protein
MTQKIRCIICDSVTHPLTRETHTNPATGREESICLICKSEITTVIQNEPVPDIAHMIIPKLSLY